MSDPAVPRFLAVHAARAKARAEAARAALRAKGQAPQVALVPPPTGKAEPPPRKRLSNPKPPAIKAAAAHKRTRARPCAAAIKVRSARKTAAAAHVMAVAVRQQLDVPQIVEFFRIHSPNLAAFEIAAPLLPDVMAAILAGATTCGPQGYQDRMTLFRMLGAPFTPAATVRVEGGRQVEALADRFVKAVARVERRLAGQASVTDEVLTIASTARDAEIVG